MSKFAQFLKKQPVQKYQCGEDVIQARKSLIKAFNAQNNTSSERALMEKTLDIVSQCPKGAEMLKDIQDIGYTLAFERGNFGGFCDPNNKIIALNPTFSINYMAQSIVHEGAHALQFSRYPENMPNALLMNSASSMVFSRIIEADAVAHENAFVWQMKDIRPALYKRAEGQTEMNKAFVSEMKKSGDEKKAMQASFNAWFDDAYYRNFYDNCHVDNVKCVCDAAIKNNDINCFTKNVRADQMLNCCLYQGKPYMSKNNLSDEKLYSVDAEKLGIMQKTLDEYAQKAGVKADQSLQNLPRRDKSGKIISKVALALKNKGRD